MHWGFGAQIKYEWENRHLSAASPARAARARRIRGLANLDRRATSICKTSRLAWGELKKIQEGADTPHFRAAGGGRSVRRYRFLKLLCHQESCILLKPQAAATMTTIAQPALERRNQQPQPQPHPRQQQQQQQQHSLRTPYIDIDIATCCRALL